MMTKKNYIIGEMKYARHSHISWTRFLSRNRKHGNSNKKYKFAGSETFHRKWVKIYDLTIKYLETL